MLDTKNVTLLRTRPIVFRDPEPQLRVSTPRASAEVRNTIVVTEDRLVGELELEIQQEERKDSV